MEKVGRKTDLTDELLKKIKGCIIDGKNLKETAKVCEIDEQKIYNWNCDNYLELSTKIDGWKRDRKIMLATKNVDEILEMETTEDKIGAFGPIKDPDTKKRIQTTNTNKLKIKADITKFTLETLDKENYSKRNEHTGKDGEALIPKPIYGGESTEI